MKNIVYFCRVVNIDEGHNDDVFMQSVAQRQRVNWKYQTGVFHSWITVHIVVLDFCGGGTGTLSVKAKCG